MKSDKLIISKKNLTHVRLLVQENTKVCLNVQKQSSFLELRLLL